jgi:formate hydrogenlyase subunit 6/NADH:ubiquinone oxidoreductase subunit I
MICPVSAITMTKIWDTVVTNRLSMDTMNAREIKRKVKKRGQEQVVLNEKEKEEIRNSLNKSLSRNNPQKKNL